MMTRSEFESLFRLSDMVKYSKQKISVVQVSALTGRGLEAVMNWLQDNHKGS